ncbi:MAG: DUF421 domain-containing protein [Carnobacterium sp.]|nr:DUF421 domain-containing protein [Carnobacterium sp.]
MDFLFKDWTMVYRTVIVGTLAYLLLIFVLRIFGKRILAKMSAFDFVVTVAFGSILATILTNNKLTLVDGMAALTLLVFLQFVLSKLILHVNFIDKLAKSEPTLLYFKGEYDEQAMKKERVLKEELYQAARSSGFVSMDDILGIVLEANGEFSVLSKSEYTIENSTLINIKKDYFIRR